MKSAQSACSSRSLTREHWDVPIRVRLLPYIEFTHWIEEELEKLVDRWSDKAAPCAERSGRRLRT